MTVTVRPFVIEEGVAHSAIRVHEGARPLEVSVRDGLPRPKFDLAVDAIAVELMTDREEEYLAATLGAFAELWLKKIREEDNHG